MSTPPSRPGIVVVAGATASGKTEAALSLARRLEGELVGADSVQVYRGFDIGSAKPTADELDGTRHHLLDVLSPTESLDAAGFARLADGAIDDIVGRGGLPIVVGGTGLWIRALLRGLVDVPPPDPAIRRDLEEEVARRGPEALHLRLEGVDPIAASEIHPRDAVRVVRALEVHAQTGQPLGALRAAHRKGAPRYPATFLVLERPREELADRIAHRIDRMLADGWLDEIREIVDRFGPEVRPLRSVGYRQLLPHVLGRSDRLEARRAAAKATRDYARRQRNWFAGEPGVTARVSVREVVEGGWDQRIAERWSRPGP